MCCRSCAECSCDHRGIITRQNEIIARQERQILNLTAAWENNGKLLKRYIHDVNELNKRLETRDAEIAALKQPPRIEPLSNLARAALDVVCKRDADDRVESQRATIARLRQELTAKDTKIANLKRGTNVAMGDIWVQHGILFPEFAPNEEHRTSRQHLHSFLCRVRRGLEQQRDDAFETQMLFPMEGEATDYEDDDEDDDEDAMDDNDEDRASA
jgi:cell division protein FtsB